VLVESAVSALSRQRSTSLPTYVISYRPCTTRHRQLDRLSCAHCCLICAVSDKGGHRHLYNAHVSIELRIPNFNRMNDPGLHEPAQEAAEDVEKNTYEEEKKQAEHEEREFLGPR
jgi:hypothetical protein